MMKNFPQKDRYTVDDLRQIVALLRAPEGCPWDKVQTHKSIRRNFLEETYEAVEAIDEDDSAHLKEELGDVLLQVMFHSRLEEEAGRFTLDDVADAECRKLLYRHPHVFGDVTVSGAGEALENWEVLKKAEHGQETQTDVLEGVARTLPALWRAEKVQKKAVRAGFAWSDASDVLDKLFEECGELRRACEDGDAGGSAREELGDLLFAAVAVARQRDIDPEAALHRACEKFIRRFRYVEETCRGAGKEMGEASQAELTAAWKAAKQAERED